MNFAIIQKTNGQFEYRILSSDPKQLMEELQELKTYGPIHAFPMQPGQIESVDAMIDLFIQLFPLKDQQS